jgi:hypothetical protein
LLGFRAFKGMAGFISESIRQRQATKTKQGRDSETNGSAKNVLPSREAQELINLRIQKESDTRYTERKKEKKRERG